MHHVARLLLLVVAVLGFTSGSLLHADDKPRDTRKCICAVGTGACQHYLRTPKKPTTEPCWCPKCENHSEHDGTSMPTGWNEICFRDKKEGAYLRRHAAAWGIICSDCVGTVKDCKVGVNDCLACAASGPAAKDYKGRPAEETMYRRLDREMKFFKKQKNVRLLYNEHFYVVTDAVSMVVKTGPTTSRKASGHEWAHIMMERAEYARREFTDAFGDKLVIDKPTGIYIPVGRRDGQGLAGRYLGNPVANILYGGSDTSSVADAFCFHGCIIPMEQFGGGDDLSIHFTMRHMIGHELMSCWVVVDGHNRALPRWLHIGVGQWLSRLQPRFRHRAMACSNEGKEMDLPGENWEKDLVRIASKSKPGAIEKLFMKNAPGQLVMDDHRRAWSYMDICLREWREPWIAALTAIRKRSNERDAFVEHLKVTPEVFEQRWIARIKGSRPHMDPLRSDSDGSVNTQTTSASRQSFRKEKDPDTLAARVRGLGTVNDARDARMLMDLLERDNDLVRETVMRALLGIEDMKVLAAAWKKGFVHKDAMVRAYTARLCALRSVTGSVEKLRAQLDDSNWYVRAETAIALGTLGDAESMTGLVKMVGDSADKAQVAAMDALAMLGETAEPTVGVVAKLLSSPKWQLRVTAAQSLGGIGSMEGVEPLIARMEIESGRVRRDIEDALIAITRDDLGKNPEFWRKWWEQQKKLNDGRIPDRPKDDTTPGANDEPDPDDRYAQAEYFGIELFANRIAFVLDTSGSMELRFTPKNEKTRGRRLRGRDKISICKSEIRASLTTLDGRSHFNIVTFGDRVKTFEKNPVKATKANVTSAIAWLKNRPAGGETNYYDALRTILDLGERPDASPNFRNTPDTITFLTDGMPTRGAITDSKTLLGWYTRLNRFSRVTTHVIAFGDKGLETELLRALAEQNYGTFVHVPGRDK